MCWLTIAEFPFSSQNILQKTKIQTTMIDHQKYYNQSEQKLYQGFGNFQPFMKKSHEKADIDFEWCH